MRASRGSPKGQLSRAGPGSLRRAGRIPGLTRRLRVRRRSPENLLIRQGQSGSSQSAREGAGPERAIGQRSCPKARQGWGSSGQNPAGGTWGAFPPDLARWESVRLGPPKTFQRSVPLLALLFCPGLPPPSLTRFFLSLQSLLSFLYRFSHSSLLFISGPLPFSAPIFYHKDFTSVYVQILFAFVLVEHSYLS